MLKLIQVSRFGEIGQLEERRCFFAASFDLILIRLVVD